MEIRLVGREPSEKTQIANLRRELKLLAKDFRVAKDSLTEYRIRATRAEQELAEWKRRFDELLKLRVDVSASGESK
jgi:phage-related tail protein